MHVAPEIKRHDMIIGQDLLQQLGITLHFGDQIIVWDTAIASMKNNNSENRMDFVSND
jgi:hypothetical protein